MEQSIYGLLGSLEVLKEYGNWLYLSLIFVGGVLLCYFGCLTVHLIAFIIGGAVGFAIGGEFGIGNETVGYKLLGLLVGGFLFAVMIGLTVFVLGAGIGASIATGADAETTIVFVSAIGVGVTALYLVNPFFKIVTAISGALSLTYVFLNLSALWNYSDFDFSKSFSGYIRHNIQTFTQFGSSAAENQVTGDAILFLVIAGSGMFVQFYMQTWLDNKLAAKMREQRKESGEEQEMT